MDFDGVAVDDRCDTDDVILRQDRCRCRKHCPCYHGKTGKTDTANRSDPVNADDYRSIGISVRIPHEELSSWIFIQVSNLINPSGLTMAPKRSLTAERLQALGTERLAGLLQEIAEDDPATMRRLRIEVTALERPDAVAAEVRNRLTQIARSRSFADWRKVRELASDLQAQRDAIVDRVVT